MEPAPRSTSPAARSRVTSGASQVSGALTVGVKCDLVRLRQRDDVHRDRSSDHHRGKHLCKRRRRGRISDGDRPHDPQRLQRRRSRPAAPAGPTGPEPPARSTSRTSPTLTGTTNNVIFFNAYSGGEGRPQPPGLQPQRTQLLPGQRHRQRARPLVAARPSLSDQGNNSLLSVTSGGTVLAPLLTTLTRTDLTIDGTATIPTGQITSYTGATITVNSGTPNFSGLTSISGDQVFANGGAVVAFPNVTALSTPNGYNVYDPGQRHQRAQRDRNPQRDRPLARHLAHRHDQQRHLLQRLLRRRARPQPPGLEPPGRNFFQVSGTGSVLDLSSPARHHLRPGQQLLAQRDLRRHPARSAPDHAHSHRPDHRRHRDDPHRPDHLVHGATITVNSGTPNFSGLTSITGDQVFANGGAVVAFPNVTALSTPSGYNLSIQASGTSGSSGTGTPSEIDLSHVTTLTGTTNNVIFFNAYSGGEVDLSHLASNPSGRNFFQVSGTGSVLDLSSLTGVVSDQANNSCSTSPPAAQCSLPLLTTLSRTDLTIDGTATIATEQITSYTGATLTLSGGTPDFSALSAVDGSNLYVSGGADLALPSLTQNTDPNGATWQASGASSLLDMSHLTTLVGATGYSTLSINAQAGGKVDLSNVTSQPSGRIYAHADGTSSVIDFSKLPELFRTPTTTQASRPATAARSSQALSPRSIAATFSSTTASRQSPPARSHRSPRPTFTSTAAAISRSRHSDSILKSQWRHRIRPTGQAVCSTLRA